MTHHRPAWGLPSCTRNIPSLPRYTRRRHTFMAAFLPQAHAGSSLAFSELWGETREHAAETCSLPTNIPHGNASRSKRPREGGGQLGAEGALMQPAGVLCSGSAGSGRAEPEEGGRLTVPEAPQPDSPALRNKGPESTHCAGQSLCTEQPHSMNSGNTSP